MTAIIQSSAATTLMLIGFVSAGLMTFRQTLGIILGADIGTTFTVQLIAFKVTDYAPAARRRRLRHHVRGAPGSVKDVGQAVLGLGLMFLGLKLILDGVAPAARATARAWRCWRRWRAPRSSPCWWPRPSARW